MSEDQKILSCGCPAQVVADEGHQVGCDQPTVPATPELDKRSKVLDDSHTIGEFIDWLGSKGMVIHQWATGLTNWAPCLDLSCEQGVKRGKPCDSCGGEGGRWIEVADRYVPISTPTEELLADFFDIDLKKVEQEQRALLDYLRKVTQ